MRNLADAGDVPAILVMQGVADIALHCSAWIGATYSFEAVGAAMLLHYGELDAELAAPAAAGPLP